MKSILMISLICLFCLTTVLPCEAASLAPYMPSKDNIPNDLSYDRFKDETTATTFLHVKEMHQMTNSNYPFFHFDIYVYCKYPGNKRINPATEVSLIFMSSSKEWVFGRDTDLYVIYDGRRYTTKPQYRGEVGSLFGSVSVTEAFVIPLSMETALQIFNSTAIDMKLGGYEFMLKDEYRKQIADFLFTVK